MSAHRARCVALLALLGSFANAHAADTSLPAIEVIGTTPLPGLGIRVDALPGNVQRFDAKDLQQAHDVTPAEFLDRNAGSVASNGASGNPFQLDLSYRGFTASPLLGTPQGLSVFLDGVRINEAFGDVVNWDLLPMNAIAEIALVPGSNPVYGLNTLGGALILTTRNGAAFPGTQGEITSGSFGRRSISGQHGGSAGALDWYATGTALDADGWREHSSSRLRQAFAKLRYHTSATTSELIVNAADNALEGTQALPRSLLDNPRQAYTWPDVTRNIHTAVTARVRHTLGQDQALTMQAYSRDLSNTSVNSNVSGTSSDAADPQAFNVRSETRTLSWGAALQYARRLPQHEITLGATLDHGRTDFDQDNTPASITAAREIVDAGTAMRSVQARTNVQQTAVYALDTWRAHERAAITMSARAQRASIDIRDRSGKSPELAASHAFARLNPAIGATYELDPGATLFANLSRGMRVPTAMELTCADASAPCSLPNIFVADPALKPVLASTIEGGARGGLGSAGTWSAAAYNTRLRDDIAFIATGAGATNAGYFANVGATQRSGLELNARLGSPHLTLTARYAYSRATYLTGFVAHSPANSSADATGAIVVHSGDRIPGVAAHLVKLRLDVTPDPRWNLGVAFAAASSQYARGNENNADPAGRIGGYAVMNLDATWRPAPRWQLDLAVANVLDRRYQTFATLASNLFAGDNARYAPQLARAEAFVGPAPPRAAWIALRYAFEG